MRRRTLIVWIIILLSFVVFAAAFRNDNRDGPRKVPHGVLKQGEKGSTYKAISLAQQCRNRTDANECLGVNGCAWCTATGNRRSLLGFTDSYHCVRWEDCQGPENQCELRTNESKCSGDEITEMAKPGATSRPRFISTSCSWCRTERRCVSLNGSRAETTNLGIRGQQCMGCDGRFDSGMYRDICGVCGGSCFSPLIRDPNQICDCVGCDGVFGSKKEFDTCGICGGDSTTCWAFTRQEKIGIVLALSGNLLISVSLITQKYSHNQNQLISGGEKHYISLPLWWAGMIMMALGETGNFLAYAYAPATIVAPLGAVSVVSNSLLARFVLKEELYWRNLAGVALAIIGSVVIVLYAPSSNQELTMDVLVQYMSETQFLIFVTFIVASLLFLFFFLSDAVKRRYVVIYTLICSLAGSLTVCCIKGVSTALVLTLQGKNQFYNVLPWILIGVVVATLVIQLKYLNMAMMHFGASEVVPVYYVLFTFCSIVAGVVLYKEYHQHCPITNPNCHYTLFFIGGCFVTFSGVYMITFARKKEGYRDQLDDLVDDVLEGGGAVETEELLKEDDLDDLLNDPPLDHEEIELARMAPRY